MEKVITVRRAEPSDGKRIAELLCYIAALHCERVPHIFKSGVGAKYGADDVKEMINDPEKIIFSAVSDGEVVGYVIAMIKSSPKNPVMRERRIFYVDDLCVDPNRHRSGIGRMLMDECVREAKALSCDTLELNVWEGNRDAKAFYEAYGMKTQRRQMEMEI